MPYYNAHVFSVKIHFCYTGIYGRVTILIGHIWPNTIHGLALSDVDLMNDISGRARRFPFALAHARAAAPFGKQR
jgi:hypothetical protein